MKSEGVGRRIGSGLPAINGDSSLDTLVIAAHELKSPLAVMRQLALELQMGHLDTKTARTVARQIQLLSERSLRHSSDLTKYKQLQTTLFATSPVHAREVWRDVARDFAAVCSHGEVACAPFVGAGAASSCKLRFATTDFTQFC